MLIDVLLAGDAELLLDLDLDGQAVRVPASLARDVESFHRAMAAEEILHRPREYVMDSGTSVGGWRTLEEHELRTAGRLRLKTAEQSFLVPEREHFALETVG